MPRTTCAIQRRTHSNTTLWERRPSEIPHHTLRFFSPRNEFQSEQNNQTAFPYSVRAKMLAGKVDGSHTPRVYCMCIRDVCGCACVDAWPLRVASWPPRREFTPRGHPVATLPVFQTSARMTNVPHTASTCKTHVANAASRDERVDSVTRAHSPAAREQRVESASLLFYVRPYTKMYPVCINMYAGRHENM